jgi:hypothetical protein
MAVRNYRKMFPKPRYTEKEGKFTFKGQVEICYIHVVHAQATPHRYVIFISTGIYILAER